jgi:uncharacterized membrane protein YbhN (UPF0104 family)
MLLAALRLMEILSHLGHAYPFGRSLQTILVGAFFSQTLISFVGGDAVRIWRLIREQIPAASATKSVLLDRIAGFAALVAIVLVTLPFLVPMLRSVEMLAGVLLIGAGALGAIVSVFVLRRLPAIFQRWKPVDMLTRFASLGVELARTGRSAAVVFGASIGIQMLNVLILFMMARGLRIEIGLWNCFVLLPTVLFLSMLPISVAGWGVREGAMVAALSLVGVPGHQSLALSICFGLCIVAISLSGGAVWFASRSRPIPDRI